MKKIFSLLLAFLTLTLCSIGLIGCSNNTTPPELSTPIIDPNTPSEPDESTAPPEYSTIALTSENFNKYISVNFSCFDYEAIPINESTYKYEIRMRVEISTAPRQSNISFSEAELVIYPDDKPNLDYHTPYLFAPYPVCQLDSNGYSNISCYIYTDSIVMTHIPNISLKTLKIYPSGYVKVQII